VTFGHSGGHLPTYLAYARGQVPSQLVTRVQVTWSCGRRHVDTQSGVDVHNVVDGRGHHGRRTTSSVVDGPGRRATLRPTSSVNSLP